jgi:hypothetical protein
MSRGGSTAGILLSSLSIESDASDADAALSALTSLTATVTDTGEHVVGFVNDNRASRELHVERQNSVTITAMASAASVSPSSRVGPRLSISYLRTGSDGDSEAAAMLQGMLLPEQLSPRSRFLTRFLQVRTD